MNKFEELLEYPEGWYRNGSTIKQALTIAAAVEKHKDGLQAWDKVGDGAEGGVWGCDPISVSSKVNFDTDEWDYLNLIRIDIDGDYYDAQFITKSANSRHIIKDILGAIKDD